MKSRYSFKSQFGQGLFETKNYNIDKVILLIIFFNFICSLGIMYLLPNFQVGCEDNNNKDKNIFERKSVYERLPSDFGSNDSVLVFSPVKWRSIA